MGLAVPSDATSQQTYAVKRKDRTSPGQALTNLCSINTRTKRLCPSRRSPCRATGKDSQQHEGCWAPPHGPELLVTAGGEQGTPSTKGAMDLGTHLWSSPVGLVSPSSLELTRPLKEICPK